MRKANVSLTPNYEFTRKEHRSFKGEKDSLPNLSVKKSNPQPIHYEDSHSREEYQKSSMETFAWVLCRRGVTKPSEQKVPAWSAFRQLTTANNPPGVNVGYLPAITLPPTQMNVILTITNRTMQYLTELELDSIFLEVDQAIYNKVLQVLFKFRQEGSTLYDKLIVRMRGFHIIIICLLRTIYSRFNGSGNVQLLSEAGVGSEGTIKASVNGGNVKQGVRYYKLLYEALLGTKLDVLERQAEKASIDRGVDLREQHQNYRESSEARSPINEEESSLSDKVATPEACDQDDNADNETFEEVNTSQTTSPTAICNIDGERHDLQESQQPTEPQSVESLSE